MIFGLYIFPQLILRNIVFVLLKTLVYSQDLEKQKRLELLIRDQVRVLSDYKSESFSNRMAAQFYPIHIGEIAGILGRIFGFYLRTYTSNVIYYWFKNIQSQKV